MPPFLPKKRLRTESPEPGPSKPSPKAKGKPRTSTTPRKPTLFDEIDAGVGPKRTASQSKSVLQKLAVSDDDSSSLSSLSDSDDEEFEDVPLAERPKVGEVSDDEDEEFEDVNMNLVAQEGPAPEGVLNLTLTKDTRVSLTNPFGTKKGPTKNERQIRMSTHQVHVQLLMWHNAIRNAWCCKREVQQILVKQCPQGILDAVQKWKRASGLLPEEKKQISKARGGKAQTVNEPVKDPRRSGDWGARAQRIATDEVDMSGGDPIYHLLRTLISYWRKRFRITAPGLRKLGYMSLQKLDEEAKSFYNDDHDPVRHGERIADIEDFKKCAQKMEGSRDVGAQLFTALLRGLGVDSRLVASLQPLGFAWSHVEEALEKNPRRLKKPKQVGVESSDEEEVSSETKLPSKTVESKTSAKSKPAAKPVRRKSRATGNKNEPIDLEDSIGEESDHSIVDVTPGKQRVLPSIPYDKNMQPIYWTEVLSPVTNTYTPVEAVVIGIVGTNAEQIERFEVRGAQSDKLKQVTAYIVGHSRDGTAKDVTTRYLKRQVWPGRTKGFRIGIEKIPIYNRHGKVKKYEEKDWFKTVMSGYVRGTKKCPRTEIDDLEESTALLPKKLEKVAPENMKESLQYYKSSNDFVLERNLKRDEALLPGAKHVKMFTVKGTKGAPSTDEKVFLRKDVVNCKSTETWHKEGRAPLPLEVPLKRVPYRVATTTRRRELAEAEHATGEKMLQGLFSWDQTDWIIPAPIENGIIPKNSYGNIDLFVDSMLPAGAVHIPYRGTVKICKRLEIDFAEAVTGFEFGNKMAVPVITGVVVPEEYYETIMDEWEKDEVERVRKEDEKRQQAIIRMWRKMLMGMRVVKRIREDYGGDNADEVDAINPFSRRNRDGNLDEAHEEMQGREEDMAGGFFLAGHEEEEPKQHQNYFPVADNGSDNETMGGGFMVEGDAKNADPHTNLTYEYPVLQASRMTAAPGEDTKSEPGDSESEAQPPLRKRARISKVLAAAGKSTLVAKKTAKKAASRKTNRGVVADADENEGSSLSSTLSDAESEAYEIPTRPRKTPQRKKTSPAKPAGSATRRTPGRAAKRKETALTSPYFTHGQKEEDEDED